jgi:uncharacterized membrane protein
MKPQEFLSQIDDERLVAAIGAAELRTSGEIRVYISHQQRPDALAAARHRFQKLGMSKTALRNAVLLYVVPRSRSFAIIGDTGIHEKCGDAFWQQVTAQLSADLKAGTPTAALAAAIHTIGELLATHFPHSDDDQNELPNEIEHD